LEAPSRRGSTAGPWRRPPGPWRGRHRGPASVHSVDLVSTPSHPDRVSRGAVSCLTSTAVAAWRLTRGLPRVEASGPTEHAELDGLLDDRLILGLADHRPTPGRPSSPGPERLALSQEVTTWGLASRPRASQRGLPPSSVGRRDRPLRRRALADQQVPVPV